MTIAELMAHLCNEVMRLEGKEKLTIVLALVDKDGVSSTIRVSPEVEEEFPLHVTNVLTILAGTFYKRYMDKDNYQYNLPKNPEELQ